MSPSRANSEKERQLGHGRKIEEDPRVRLPTEDKSQSVFPKIGEDLLPTENKCSKWPTENRVSWSGLVGLAGVMSGFGVVSSSRDRGCCCCFRPICRQPEIPTSIPQHAGRSNLFPNHGIVEGSKCRASPPSHPMR